MWYRVRIRSRPTSILLALLSVSLCLAGLSTLAAHQSAASIPVQLGRVELTFELDRSPDCPNHALGLCDARGQGPVYLAIWRYAWTTATTREALRLLAVPVAP
jgi:hypothetical protein